MNIAIAIDIINAIGIHNFNSGLALSILTCDSTLVSVDSTLYTMDQDV